MKSDYIDSVKWENGKLIILDQTRIPEETVFEELNTAKQVWDAIYLLKVRGAPAIGIAAAYGICVTILDTLAESYDAFYEEFSKNAEYLDSSRPTAVNLHWALERMKKCVIENKGKSIPEIKQLLINEAHTIKEENSNVCKAIGENFMPYFKAGMGILTHCNAGAIATASKYGTALSPMYLAHELGMKVKVFADETRPLNQGSRLTSWELQMAGIDVTLICDNMAAAVMAKGEIQAVIVGCDRVAKNGDFANKIGTYGVAILAKEHNIPFYVAAPMSTIDMSTKTGENIIIEERNPEEITNGFGKRTAPFGINVYNPAFDVTPNKYVTAIITEKGAIHPPFDKGLKKIFEDK